jgi:beta-N-acetylhexosaminidase
MGARAAAAVVVASAALLAAGCAPSPLLPPGVGATQSATGEASSTVTPLATADPVPTRTSCRSVSEGLDERARVGQLFMLGVSTSGLDETTRSAISLGRVGSVVLLGNTTAGVDALRILTAELGSLGTAEVPLLIAADQEGGTVQRLRGEGFDRIPEATVQGRMAPGELREASALWGGQLAAAGVHYNLAPVADVVPVEKQGSNAPIGVLARNYGNDVATVSRSVTEFVEGMTAAGIATSLKHFPGLGEVAANTDFDAAVDDDTTAESPSLDAFRAGIDAGVGSVMVSSAIFSRIDPDVEGVFSRVVITDLLRNDLGFDGVVIADDLGAAKAVSGIPPADRAVRFLAAGGDLVINADPAIMADMVDAAAAEAEADQGFADQLLDSVERVLRLKASVGLVDCA